MSLPLRILRTASSDIAGIFDWLNSRSPRGAAAWYAVLFETIKQIEDKPDSFPIAPEMLPRWNRKIHHALFKTSRGRRYRIVFELTESEIRILRVRGPGQPPLRSRELPTN